MRNQERDFNHAFVEARAWYFTSTTKPLAGVGKMHDDINNLIGLALLPIFQASTEGVNYGRS